MPYKDDNTYSNKTPWEIQAISSDKDTNLSGWANIGGSYSLGIHQHEHHTRNDSKYLGKILWLYDPGHESGNSFHTP